MFGVQHFYGVGQFRSVFYFRAAESRPANEASALLSAACQLVNRDPNWTDARLSRPMNIGGRWVEEFEFVRKGDEVGCYEIYIFF